MSPPFVVPDSFSQVPTSITFQASTNVCLSLFKFTLQIATLQPQYLLFKIPSSTSSPNVCERSSQERSEDQDRRRRLQDESKEKTQDARCKMTVKACQTQCVCELRRLQDRAPRDGRSRSAEEWLRRNLILQVRSPQRKVRKSRLTD